MRSSPFRPPPRLPRPGRAPTGRGGRAPLAGAFARRSAFARLLVREEGFFRWLALRTHRSGLWGPPTGPREGPPGGRHSSSWGGDRGSLAGSSAKDRWTLGLDLPAPASGQVFPRNPCPCPPASSSQGGFLGSGLYRNPRRSSSAAFASVLHSCARPFGLTLRTSRVLGRVLPRNGVCHPFLGPPAVPLRGTVPPPFGGGAGARSGLVLVGMSGLGARIRTRSRRVLPRGGPSSDPSRGWVLARNLRFLAASRPSARPPSNGPTAPRSRRWPFGVGGRWWRRAARGCPRPSAQRSTAFPLPSDAPAASRPRRGRGTCPRSARRRNVGAFGTQALYRSFRTSPVGSSSRRSLGPSVASPATSGGWGRPRARRALRAPDRPSSRGVARYVAPVGR